MRRVVVAGIVEEVARADGPPPAEISASPASRGPVPKSLGQLGREHAAQLIADALRKFGGKKVQAARYLGVSRVTLWRRISKYGLPAGKE